MTITSADNGGQGKHRRYFVLMIVSVLLLVFLYMISAIIAGVVVGVLLWIMTRGIYEWLLRRTRQKRGLAAGFAVLATVLLVIVPLAVVVLVMVADAVELASVIQDQVPAVQARIDEWVRLIDRDGLSLFGFELSIEQLKNQIGELSTRIGQFLFTLAQRTAGSLVTTVIMLFIALYTLYFFYTDGDRFFAWLKDTLPLDPRHTGKLIDSFVKSSIATLKMIGVIGVVQGVAAGIAYVIIGVPAPFFLTILTIISTVIPSVGPGLVIIPVAAGLVVAGQTGWAIALLAWGGIVIGNLDNILRPYLVHKAIQIHQLVLFVVMIGGIIRFGFFGVFIGPVVASLFAASLDIYRELYPRPAEFAPRVPDESLPPSSRE